MLGGLFLSAVRIVPNNVQFIEPIASKRINQLMNSLSDSEIIPDPDSTNPDPVDPIEPEPTDPTDPPFEFSSDLIIKAINPGYKIDGISDVGELIELQNLTDAPLSLAGFSLRYTNSSGKSMIISEFTEGALMTGEYLLMRYTKSPDHDLSDLTYKTSLAMTAGPLELLYEGELVDSVCWTGKGDCYRAFKSSNQTTLVRDLETGDFEHLEEYVPSFRPGYTSLILPPDPDEDDPDEEEPTMPQCRGLEFSEIFSYYNDSPSDQFIEFYNATTKPITLDGCQVRYKNKAYELSGLVAAESYYAYYPNSEFTLTKNPTSFNTVELIDIDNKTVDKLTYPRGQKKSASYARFFDENGAVSWLQSYAITPNSANIYQEYRTCPAGKVINPETGNCVNISSIKSSTLADCPEGKYRNPLTGRCKNIETSTSTLKECAEGYERNPETNRCRKITSDNDGTSYPLTPATGSNQSAFIAIGSIILLLTCGVIYITLQFRHEIVRATRKICQRLNHFRKDLIAGKIGLNRHKKS